MKLVDANVLIYAVNKSDPSHERSRRWLDDALTGQEAIGFSWIVLLAFLRLATRPEIFPRPLPVEAVTSTIREWLAQPPSVVAEPTARHVEVLAGVLDEVGTGGNLVSDTHLAALAIEHRATIVTFDADFERFAGVRWERPEA